MGTVDRYHSWDQGVLRPNRTTFHPVAPSIAFLSCVHCEWLWLATFAISCAASLEGSSRGADLRLGDMRPGSGLV